MAIPLWSKKLIDKFFLFVFVTKSLFYSRKNVQIYFLMYIYCAMDVSVRLSVSNVTSAFAIYVLTHNTIQLVRNLLQYDDIFVVKK